jgi:predicted small lipoprotein YifL
MLKSESILCSPRARPALVLTAALLLGACGQRGPLYLPTDPASVGRATLPQVLNPTRTLPDTRAPTSPPAPAGSEAVPENTGTGTASPINQ